MNEKLKEILIPVEIKLPDVLGLELNMTIKDIAEIDQKYKAKGSLISLAVISLESALKECREAQKKQFNLFERS